jgi:predicted HicB family RNase H-like nuclease
MAPRKDKPTQPHRYLSVRLPHDVVELLGVMADRKGISRNRLIIQTLRRVVTPRKAKKGAE